MSVIRKSLVEAVEKALKGGDSITKSTPYPGARLERLGTIFSRTTGLIKSNVLRKTEIPLWYHVYQASPPKFEPLFDRPPIQDIQIKHIFYPEDHFRSKTAARRETINMFSNEKTETQKLMEEFKRLKKESPGQSNEDIIKKIQEEKVLQKDW